MSDTERHSPAWPKLLIAMAMIGLFTVLRITDHLGDVAYSTLATLSVLTGIILHGFDRAEVVDFLKLRLTLRRVEDAQRDLFVREEKFKAIVLPLAAMLALASAMQGRLGGPDFWGPFRQWYRAKLSKLSQDLGDTHEEAAETLKYMDAFRELDAMFHEKSDLATEEAKAAMQVQIDTRIAMVLDMLRTDAGAE